MAQSGRFNDQGVPPQAVRPPPQLRQIRDKEMVRADIPAQTGDTGKPQALKDIRVPGFQTVDLAHAGRHAAVGQQQEQAFQNRRLSHGGSAGEKEHLTRHREPPILEFD